MKSDSRERNKESEKAQGLDNGIPKIQTVEKVKYIIKDLSYILSLLGQINILTSVFDILFM